jgi:hypothetical protein
MLSMELSRLIIYYGHSWGGSETVALAKRLQRERIRVLLTAQIDSVAKTGQNDWVIPASIAHQSISSGYEDSFSTSGWTLP